VGKLIRVNISKKRINIFLAHEKNWFFALILSKINPFFGVPV